MESGTAKQITEITDDRIIITHQPTRYVSIYVDPRQSGEDMDKEATWIRDRILFLEKFYKERNEIKRDI